MGGVILLSAKDVVKALEICASPPGEYRCIECPLYDTEGNCKISLTICCLNTINQLQKDVADKNEEINKLKREMSYMVSPNTIGNRHEMGCW